MEKSADAGPSGSIPTYPVVLEESRHADVHIDVRRNLDLHHASSSPDLNSKIKPSLPDLGSIDVSLSRTRTLPLRSPKRGGPALFPSIQGTTFEVENLERLRRWVLGLAIGKFRFVNLAFHSACLSIAFLSRIRPRTGALIKLHIPTIAVVPVRS